MKESNDGKNAITLDAVGRGEKRAVMQAVKECGHDIPVKTSVELSDLSEERVEDLLDALLDVEKKLSDMGAYMDADSSSVVHNRVVKTAREEGLL